MRGTFFLCRLWPTEDEGTIAAEVAEGESFLRETIARGGHFEVGQPFELTKFGDSREWLERPFPRTRDIPKTPQRSRPRTPVFRREDFPALNRPPIPPKPPEQALDCSFCGRKHYPTSPETVQCMGVYWALYHMRGQKAPTQAEVCQYLYPNEKAATS